LPAASRERRKEKTAVATAYNGKEEDGEMASAFAGSPTWPATRSRAREAPRTASVSAGEQRKRRKQRRLGYCSSNTTSFLHFLFSLNYSQICIATLKSPKTKVVQLLEISNFAFWTKLRF
jgi:hypothetical protein